MMDKNLVLQEEHFYKLLSFLISSAYLMSQGEEFEELYPSLRLIDAANRLTKYALESGGLEDESWPRSFIDESEKGLDLMGIDNEAFIGFLIDSTRMLAKEMKRREEV
ncbi:MAG: hypothetical protein WBF05_04670 [Anaerolineales bacterium]